MDWLSFHTDGQTLMVGLMDWLHYCTDGWALTDSLMEWSHDGQMGHLIGQQMDIFKDILTDNQVGQEGLGGVLRCYHTDGWMLMDSRKDWSHDGWTDQCMDVFITEKYISFSFLL